LSWGFSFFEAPSSEGVFSKTKAPPKANWPKNWAPQFFEILSLNTIYPNPEKEIYHGTQKEKNPFGAQSGQSQWHHHRTADPEPAIAATLNDARKEQFF
jgi:hypothetical protein